MNNGLIAVATGPVDPAIAVSMVGDIVVLSPRGRLDLDATYALVQAVDAASCSDRKVVIDLDGSAELVARRAVVPHGGRRRPTVSRCP